MLCLAKVFFSLLVIKIRIIDLEYARRPAWSTLTQVKKHYRVAISFVDGSTYDSIILSIIRCKYSHDGTGQTTLDKGGYNWQTPSLLVPGIIYIGNHHTNTGYSSSKSCRQWRRHQISTPGSSHQECGEYA